MDEQERQQFIERAVAGERVTRQLITTGIDGSGAIGVLAHCRNKRKNVFGSLVLKQGVGVRDAWAQEGITQKEIDRAFLDAAVVDQFTIAPDFLPMRSAISWRSGIRPARCRRSGWYVSSKPSVSLRFSLN
jgi:hypothetical protein